VCRWKGSFFIPLRSLAPRIAVLVVVLYWLGAGRSQAQTAGFYQVDPQGSRVEIRVFRSGFLAPLGDNHEIILKRFSGTLAGDFRQGWKVRVEAEVASLEVLDPDASAPVRAEIQKTMLGPTQMDVQRFPTIELRGWTQGPARKEGTWMVLADLTVHGVTQRVQFPVNWTEQGKMLRVQGAQFLRLTDFGIVPIRRALGAVRVRNQFEVDYNLALHRVAPNPK
jgi:polyisoprenoid-binding protein YceI